MPGSDLARRIFELFARLHPAKGDRLDEPGFQERVLDSLKDEIDRSLNSDIWLHGRRIQSMFEAMVVAFDRCKLIKTEDAGTIHPEEQYALPDFRIVLGDGSQILVEVKNVYNRDPTRQRYEMRADYLEQLDQYARVMGCPLKLAIFWARWGLWTLIDPRHLEGDGDVRSIDMLAATPVNEMLCIGDQTIGTRAPLKIRLLSDPAKERRILEDGRASLTIAGHEVCCQDSVLTDEDVSLALLLIEFGEWEESEPVAIMDGEIVEAIESRWTPIEPSDQGFDIVGTASRMFARYYSLHTVEGGRIVKVGVPLQPGLFRVLTVGDGTGHTLPLWRFHLKATDPKAKAA